MIRRRTVGLSLADMLTAYRWSLSDDFSEAPMPGMPAFASQAAAERAWPACRRAVWEETHRFAIPAPARVFDGLSILSRDVCQRTWNCETYELDPALEALAIDRENLARFRRTAEAATIADFLGMLAADLDEIERTARTLAGWPAGDFRPYPANLSTARRYGAVHDLAGHVVPHDDDDEETGEDDAS